jgi:hypothetical protein
MSERERLDQSPAMRLTAQAGKLLATGERFLAVTPSDPHTLDRMERTEALGLPGTVTKIDGQNLFMPNFAA